MIKVNELRTPINCLYEMFQWVFYISFELFSTTFRQIAIFEFWSDTWVTKKGPDSLIGEELFYPKQRLAVRLAFYDLLVSLSKTDRKFSFSTVHSRVLPYIIFLNSKQRQGLHIQAKTLNELNRMISRKLYPLIRVRERDREINFSFKQRSYKELGRVLKISGQQIKQVSLSEVFSWNHVPLLSNSFVH